MWAVRQGKITVNYQTYIIAPDEKISCALLPTDYEAIYSLKIFYCKTVELLHLK